MADHKHRDIVGFRNIQKTGGALFDLGHRAGRRVDVGAAHGLDGVDDHKPRLQLLDQAADLVHIALGCQQDVILGHVQTHRTQLDLPHRFLAGDIQHAAALGYLAAQLEQDGRFADARLAADQRHAAQHDAAAQHPVQFADAGYNAAFFLGGADVFQLQCGQAGLAGRTRRGGCPAGGRFGRFGHHVLGHGVPGAAGRAASQPAGAGLAAVGADVDGFQLVFWHGPLRSRHFFCLRGFALV